MTADGLPFIGYNFASAIEGNFIPQRLQNLCIRDYANTKSLTLSMPVAEYEDTRQSLMLFAQIPHLKRLAGIIFYSILLLPPDPKKRIIFYQHIIGAGKTVHFALEDLSFSSKQESEKIESIYRMSLDRRAHDISSFLIAHRDELDPASKKRDEK